MSSDSRKLYHQTAASNNCHQTAGSNVIIRKQEAMSTDSRNQCHQTAGSNVIRQQEAMSSDSGKQCHQTAGSNVIRQQEAMSSPDSRKTETVKMIAFIALQLTHIHKQITSHKSDIPFGESAHRQVKSNFR